MKIENLKEVTILSQYINGIGNGAFLLGIKKGQEHEIINALKKIKSNMIDELKELGVEV